MYIFKTLIIILTVSICNDLSLANESSIHPEYHWAFNRISEEVFGKTMHEVQIESLKGGYSGDELFLISSNRIKVVLRIYDKIKNIKYKQLEYQASKNASGLGIGPKVVYVSKDYDLLATEYINVRHPGIKEMRDHRSINYIVESLLRLHNGPKLPNDWSVFEYIRRIIPENLTDKEKISLAELTKIEESLAKNNFPDSPSHNDIQPNNLFIIKNKVLFIDWGDAGMSDPFWDLARISMEFAFDSAQDSYLLDKYLGRVTNLDKSRFFIMKQVFLLRSAFCLKHADGSPNKETIEDIIKIFESNDYPLYIDKDEGVTWRSLGLHAMNLFLKNSKTDLYQESLKMLEDNYALKKNIVSM